MREPLPAHASFPPPSSRRQRDARLDALRGLALVMIFVDHVPGTVYEGATLRNFGLSDAAEGFVLMAGISAGLAYGPAFRPGGDLRAGLGRVWGRAWSLYLVHILVTVVALGIAAGLALWAGAPALLGRHNVDVLLDQPLQALAGLPLLLFQLDYADILPIYAALLALAPGLLWLGWRRPWWLLGGSALLWLVAGEARLNLPTWPQPDGWFLSPFSWQLLFVVGLLTGLRLREGRRLVPVRRWLVALCGAALVLGLLWRGVPLVGAAMNHGLWWLAEAGVPWTLTSFHKTWETAPRLLHSLALAYVLSALPFVRRACESRWAAPLALLGRHALPVFGLGSMLAFLLQGIRAETGPRPLLDGVMLAAGLLLQWGIARVRDGRRA